MTFGESIFDALTEVRTHKLRTFLQTLGVILGVASLVAVQGLMDAGRRETMRWMNQMGGLNKMIVFNRPPKDTTLTAKQLASRGLTFDDAQEIKAQVKEVAQIGPVLEDWLQVRIGNYLQWHEISGSTPDYPAIFKHYPAQGRFLAEADMARSARVVVLGESAARIFFGNEPPLGRTLTIGDTGFVVVGVLQRKEFLGEDGENHMEWMNRQIFVPLTAMFARFSGDEDKKVSYIHLVSDKVENNTKIQETVTSLLERRHGGVKDFEVFNRSDRLARRQEQEQTFNITFLVTGIVSLIVGGIVIMNIMLASYQERVREVGVRKAFGAKGGDIAVQFLVESVLVTSIGGTVGLALGLVFSRVMSSILGFQTVVTAQMAMVGVISSVTVGVAFGLYPAIKAARLNPVDALRYE